MAFASNPPRRTERRTHLNVDTAIVERALLARAERLEDVPEETGEVTGEAVVREWAAAEFRNLAEELHWR